MVLGQRSRLYNRASQLEQRRKLLCRDREWIDHISDGSAQGLYPRITALASITTLSDNKSNHAHAH